MGVVSKTLFHALAASQGIKALVSRYGMRDERGFARRFIAGETVADAVAAATRLETTGTAQTLQYLGASAATIADADAATRAFIGVLDEIAAAPVSRNVSLKLTQFGLMVDRATSVDNMRRILDPAAAREFFVRIDMEDSRYTQVTFDIFETLWQQGYRNAGVVLQSGLRRSVEDAKRMNALGARVRLVKGAYREPKGIAHTARAEVDAAYRDIMQLLLTEGTEPAFATHDPALIEETRTFAASRGIGADRYEFQMLYGIGRDLQRSLGSAGHRVRVSVPFGQQWFPYFMDRLGERPSNLGFVFRRLLIDR